jgi:hypothetical protein
MQPPIHKNSNSFTIAVLNILEDYYVESSYKSRERILDAALDLGLLEMDRKGNIKNTLKDTK